MASFRAHSTFLLLLAVSVPISASPVTYQLSDSNGPEQITFESNAPAEYIKGVANGLEGNVTIDPAKQDLAMSGTAIVPVERISTGDSKRDDDLRSEEWLNAARTPSIRFDLAQTDLRTVVKKGENSWFVKATGSFFLNGICRYITVPLAISMDGQKLRIDGRFTVLLADHDISGPTGKRIIGVKVAPEIHLRLRLVGMAEQGKVRPSHEKKHKRREKTKE